MIRLDRRISGVPSGSLPIVVVAIALLATSLIACSPDTGAIGTPATPAVTPIASEGPTPSDEAPATVEPTATPSEVPSASSSPAPTGSPATSASPTPTPARPTPTPTPAGTTIVRAYFFLGSFTGNEGLAPVLREVPQTKAVATAAMHALLDGPNADEMGARPAMYSAIPDGTRLLGVSIRNGVATVDLSGEFASGGGSASVLGRLAQVVYTLTQFSTVDKVRFELDGQPATVFSAEGIVLDHPVGRSDYQDQLPAIFIDRPAWGASLGNPGRVSGLANVFEATFQVQLRNGAGKLIANQTVIATCGTGCWGSFKVDLSYTVARAQYGTLRVFDLSARDGSPENVTEYEIWLTPAG